MLYLFNIQPWWCFLHEKAFQFVSELLKTIFIELLVPKLFSLSFLMVSLLVGTFRPLNATKNGASVFDRKCDCNYNIIYTKKNNMKLNSLKFFGKLGFDCSAKPSTILNLQNFISTILKSMSAIPLSKVKKEFKTN